MSKIAFERVFSEFTILNPFNNFLPEQHRVEVRKDPLLGDRSIYNPYLKDKKRAFFAENDQELIQRIAEDSAKSCIFCGENLMVKTARYPEELLPGGRIRLGEAVLFANLFSLGLYHPVIVLGKKHFLNLEEFTAPLIADGFGAAQEFLHSVYRADPSTGYGVLCTNYLFPAGASLVHPHLQMLLSPIAYSYHYRVLNACKRYYENNGSSYFDDLVAEELQKGERFIARRHRWSWLAAYSPMGNNEITAVHERECDFGMLSSEDIEDLALGISNVLLLYERSGHMSFNFALYSVRRGMEDEGFRCIFRIVSRQNLYPNYRNDDYFLQKLLQSELIFNLPEELAVRLRGIFEVCLSGS